MSDTYIHCAYELRIIAGTRNAAYTDKIMFAIEYNKLKTELEHLEETLENMTSKDIVDTQHKINYIKNEMTVKYNNMIAFNAECDEIIKNCERVLSLS
jgi:hypothetical protein